MAAPSVLGRNTTSGGPNTSVAISFDATPTAGQLLTVEFMYGGSANVASVGSGSGWSTETQIDAAGNLHATVFRKVADGSDSLTISLGNARWAYTARRISGGAWGGIQSATGASGNANPPNNAPGLGSTDFLWLAGCIVATTTVPSAAPSGYGNLQTANPSGGTLSLGSAEKTATSVSSEDPGTFTNNSVAWAAWTIAVNDNTAGTDGNAGGASLSHTFSASTGAATGGASAAGAAQSVTFSVSGGAATGAASANGAALSFGESVSGGAATGNAGAQGDSLSIGLSLAAGAATGSAQAAGTGLEEGYSFSAGAASGEVVASGAALVIGYGISGGAAVGSSAATGSSLTINYGFAPGQVSNGDLPRRATGSVREYTATRPVQAEMRRPTQAAMHRPANVSRGIR